MRSPEPCVRDTDKPEPLLVRWYEVIPLAGAHLRAAAPPPRVLPPSRQLNRFLLERQIDKTLEELRRRKAEKAAAK